MEILADSWVLWLILSGLAIGAMRFYRQTRRNETSMFTSAEEFSIRTILFGLRKGEGDLFLGFVISMVCFAMFLAGFIRWIRTIF